jgi:hypothetical protein
MSGGISQDRNIGEQVTVRQIAGGVPPRTLTGSTVVSGGVVDRRAINDPASCVLHVAGGTVTGAPTSATVTAQLEHCATSNGTFAAYGTALTVDVTSGGAEASENIDLSGANEFIQTTLTPAFVAGTSPGVPASATVVFGGGQELPSVS